jgi:hypothetical protein
MEDFMSGLEIYSSDQPGFKPLIDFGNWRTAVSNGPLEYQQKNVSSLSRHLETDEVFVLLRGSCLLLTAGNGNEIGEIARTWLEEGQMYNVTKGTWHNTILLPGAKVMIVENRDTGDYNSEFKQLSQVISL